MSVQPTQWERYGKLRTYQSGEYLFKEGDSSDCLAVIKSGRVAIIKGAQSATPLTFGYRDAGRFLGEVSLIQETERTASVQAVEPTQAWIISRDVFWQVLDTDSGFRRQMLMTLVNHLLAADVSRELAASTERTLDEAFRLRRETTNFIVHDLQNPLNIVMAALAMMADMPGYETEPDLADAHQMATQAVERMLNLIGALLDTEKLKGGNADLHLAPEDIGEVISGVVHQNQAVVRQKHLTLLALDISGSLPEVTMDRARIERVLTNLIDNAVKFTPAGGQITVSAYLAGDAIFVVVSDTGPGIPPEERQWVFERFTQAEAGQRLARGFGLGLAYCLSAVQAHGGRIWVEEGDGGVGARFVFTLPLGPPLAGRVQ